MMNERQHLSSLKRGLNVLALLNRSGTLTISQIAKKVSLPRTTALRVIETLVVEGYIERAASAKTFQLTPAVIRLSAGFADDSWICHCASDLLFEKTREIGWPMAVSTAYGDQMMTRISTDSVTSLALNRFPVGYKVPIMYASAGHVTLAHAAPSQREAILNLIRQSTNPHQMMARNTEMVDHLIEKVRRQGFAHVSYPDAPEASMAVPLFLKGEFIAGVLVRYIKRAFPNREKAEEALLPMLKDMAAKIEISTANMKEATTRSFAIGDH